MRFLADMGIGTRVTEWLRQAGHDVRHLRDEGLQRMPDPEVFAKAALEDRVLLTFDLDFGEIVASSGNGIVSVVLFRLHNARPLHVINRLQQTLADCSEALERGAVVVVEESRHRVRLLPIGGPEPEDAL